MFACSQCGNHGVMATMFTMLPAAFARAWSASHGASRPALRPGLLAGAGSGLAQALKRCRVATPVTTFELSLTSTASTLGVRFIINLCR
jgi:hypothetical protein